MRCFGADSARLNFVKHPRNPIKAGAPAVAGIEAAFPLQLTRFVTQTLNRAGEQPSSPAGWKPVKGKSQRNRKRQGEVKAAP